MVQAEAANSGSASVLVARRPPSARRGSSYGGSGYGSGGAGAAAEQVVTCPACHAPWPHKIQH